MALQQAKTNRTRIRIELLRHRLAATLPRLIAKSTSACHAPQTSAELIPYLHENGWSRKMTEAVR
jgi:hypothetical protein